MFSASIFATFLMFYMRSALADVPSASSDVPHCLALSNITEIAQNNGTSKYLLDVLNNCTGAVQTLFTFEAQIIYNISALIKPIYESIKKVINDTKLTESIRKCVNEATSKNFIAKDAMEKFGFKDTKALSFSNENCDNSNRLSKCIRKLEETTHKDFFAVILEAFKMISTTCEQFTVREDRNRCPHLYSSTVVTFSSAMILMITCVL